MFGIGLTASRDHLKMRGGGIRGEVGKVEVIGNVCLIDPDLRFREITYLEIRWWSILCHEAQ